MRTNWIDLRHDDINVHASNITEHILEISKQCIPNRIIKIKPSDPPWITTAIKRLIRNTYFGKLKLLTTWLYGENFVDVEMTSLIRFVFRNNPILIK